MQNLLILPQWWPKPSPIVNATTRGRMAWLSVLDGRTTKGGHPSQY